MGRSDSAKAPYLTPSIHYFHTSGLFIRSSLSYLTAQEQNRIDLYTLSAGYGLYRKRFAAGVSASAYFFDKSSYTVQAEMNTYLNAYAGYDFHLLLLYIDASLGFSDDTDVFLGATISHSFYLCRDKLLITPAVQINAGSQHYYNEYYSQRSVATGTHKGKGKGTPQAHPVTDIHLQAYDKFQVLDYEATLLASYTVHKLRFFASCTLTLPLNPATVISQEAVYTEELKNSVYWSVGTRLKLP